jgi:hypothetical protein
MTNEETRMQIAAVLLATGATPAQEIEMRDLLAVPERGDGSLQKTDRDVALTGLIWAYSFLAPIGHEWSGRNTAQGQRLMSELRDAIAHLWGTEPEQVQDRYARYPSPFAVNAIPEE